MNIVENTVRHLESLGSRMTGYPGCTEASEFIFSKFVEYGLVNVSYHTFNITMPIDYGATITVLGDKPITLKAYPFLPNLVAPVVTPLEGISGPLIYVHEGGLSDYGGKDAEGSIVLMDFNTRDRWLDAAKMGAKVVLFLAPEETFTEEAKLKVLENVPFNFPRLYLKKEDANVLINLLEKGSVNVLVKSLTRWEVKTARNVMGWVLGKEYPDQIVILSAHYDSFSYVPSVAPGADEASGIASLLEMARFYASNPAKCTILFLAFSGTRQNCWGSRWFVKDWVEGRYSGFGQKIVLNINIDINSESRNISPFIWGFLYAVGTWTLNLIKWHEKFMPWMFDQVIPAIENSLGKTFVVMREATVFGATWGGTAGSPRFILPTFLPAFDTEPLMMIGVPSFTWTSNLVVGKPSGTPLDTSNRIDVDNLKNQLDLIWSTIYKFVNTKLSPDYVVPWSLIYLVPQRVPGWVDLTGLVTEYDTEKAWYKPVPNAIFVAYPAFTYAGTYGVRDYVLTGKDGKVFVPGIGVGTSWAMSAYVVNSTTGNIEYAPDMGRYLFAQPWVTVKSSLQDFGFFNIFKCGSLVLFDIGDPNFLNQPTDSSITFSILDFRAHANPDFYGHSWSFFGADGRSILMAHVMPNVPSELMVHCSYAMRFPLAALINATSSNPTGSGYKVQGGEQVTLTHTSLQLARDLYWLNDERIHISGESGVKFFAAANHEKTRELIEQALQSIRERDYANTEACSTLGWRTEREVYSEVRSNVEDIILTTPFFGFLIVPFALLAERLFFHKEGLKRIIVTAVCYTLPLILLWIFHPGMRLASNALMVFMGFIIVILISPVFSIIFSSFTELISSLRRKAMGLHFVEMSRSSVATLSFSVGVENLRRRRLRSALTLITVITITTSMVALTSMSAIKHFATTTVEGTPTYQGVLLRHTSWGQCVLQTYAVWGAGGYVGGATALGERVVEVLSELYGDKAIISPAAWYEVPGVASTIPFVLFSGSKSLPIAGILGLTPEESRVTGVDKIALKEGRWFLPTDEYAVIICESQAAALAVKLFDKVSLQGVEFTVIGIVYDSAFNSVLDLNREKITPLDYREPGFETHLSIVETIILPYKVAMSMGGFLMRVSLLFKDPEMIRPAAEEIFNRFRLPVLYAKEGKIYSLSEKQVYAVMGWQYQIIPVALVVATLVNMALGSVYERTKEIGILSSVGLSPFHVAFIFLAEYLVYAVLGGVIGYDIGMGVIAVSSALLPEGAPLNYASTWVVTVVGIGMLTVIASLIYPMYRSSTLVTPSLERKWKVPKPVGDQWSIPLPYTTSSTDETQGFLSYVHELFETHRGEGSSDFSVSKMRVERKVEAGMELTSIGASMSLEPYGTGVHQEVSLLGIKDLSIGRYSFLLNIKRLEGQLSNWLSQNDRFIDIIRKQILLWRALRPGERETYSKRFKQAPSGNQ